MFPLNDSPSLPLFLLLLLLSTFIIRIKQFKGPSPTAPCYFQQRVVFCDATVFWKPPTHSRLMWSDHCGELKTIITVYLVFTFCLARVSYQWLLWEMCLRQLWQRRSKGSPNDARLGWNSQCCLKVNKCVFPTFTSLSVLILKDTNTVFMVDQKKVQLVFEILLILISHVVEMSCVKT